MLIRETLPDVSKRYKTELSASIAAQDLSNRYRDWFIYVCYNYAGFWAIDYLGIKYSDEKIVSTFYRGEKTL